MNGLIIRILIAMAFALWAIEIFLPLRHLLHSEENPYYVIKDQQEIVVGTINNPVSYFIGSERQAGFEHDLSKAFAEYLGVELNIKAFDNCKTLFEALENHDIDIAAANLIFHPKKAEQYSLGPAYYSASWQLTYRKGHPRPISLKQLNGKLVIVQGSDLSEILAEQQVEYPDLTWETATNQTQEGLLLQVAEGKIDYTIANSIDVSATQQVRPEIAVAFDVTDESTMHWYLANNSYNELQAALLDFMNHSRENGLLANIEEKYFNHFNKFNYVDMRAYTQAIEKTLPKYTALFQKYQGNLDWRLLAAVSYQESHWDAQATSPTGVRGMMMLTKATAEFFKITDRTDAGQSIKAGSEYLHWLIDKVPDTVPKEDRIWFALASYNMGLGHMLDARLLTKNLGGDPDNWLDVKKNLPLLAEKRHYSTLKYGYARGYEAFQYVENIRRYMNSIVNYHRVKDEQNTQNSSQSTQ